MEQLQYKCSNCGEKGAVALGSATCNAMLTLEYTCHECGKKCPQLLTKMNGPSWNDDFVAKEANSFYGQWYLWLETDEGKIAVGKARYDL